MDSHLYDTLVKQSNVVRAGYREEILDIAIKDGRFAAIAPNLSPEDAKEVVDGSGLLAFPGVVDAHMHTGIYAPLDQDARSESRAAAMGGVTTSLNYIRTGQYYLNRGGPYADFFPEVLRLSAGNFHVDYGFHVAPMTPQHIKELPLLANEYGINSFKIFMFYGSHGLHGRSSSQKDFLMIGEEDRYDIAHFEQVMRGIQQLNASQPDAFKASLSLHCETAEIMTAYTRMVEEQGTLTGLHAYSASRPPHSEGLAIFIASYLAHETACKNINLLHLSSRKAVEAAKLMSQAFPHINFRREVTIGHLLLDVDCPNGVYAKVNPPIRPREDVEYIWQALLEGELHWVVSDHACCAKEAKVNAAYPNDVFLAKSGFGGTEYLLSGLLTEGKKRGLSYEHAARLLSKEPAVRFGLAHKGQIAVGFDADLALIDPNKSFVVGSGTSESHQGYSPFDGMELSHKVEKTFLRGSIIYDEDKVQGPPKGRYLKRTGAPD